MLVGLKLLLQSLSPHRSAEPDPLHPSKRRKTQRYRHKKKTVQALWLAAALMMMAFPLVHFVVTLGLFTTFLSFSILDESG